MRLEMPVKAQIILRDPPRQFNAIVTLEFDVPQQPSAACASLSTRGF